MFRTVPLSIIMSFSRNVLILLASCQQTCMTYTIAACTVKNSWWWTEELSETCRILFQKQIWEIFASSWFYYKNFLQVFCTEIQICTEYCSVPSRAVSLGEPTVAVVRPILEFPRGQGMNRSDSKSRRLRGYLGMSGAKGLLWVQWVTNCVTNLTFKSIV